MVCMLIKNSVYLCLIFLNTFLADFKENIIESNDSTAAILSMVPPVFHKYLTTKSKNNSNGIYTIDSRCNVCCLLYSFNHFKVKMFL